MCPATPQPTTNNDIAAVPSSDNSSGGTTADFSDKTPANNNDNNNNKYPSDWPGPGPINLQVHDLPHMSSSAEWWYLNAHLDVQDDDSSSNKNEKKKNKTTKKMDAKQKGEDNDDKHPGVSVFASFFRMALQHDEEHNEYVFGHSMAWAVMDHRTEKYYNISLIGPYTPPLFLEQLKKDTTNKGSVDLRLKKALMEVLEKNQVPYPDRLLKGDGLVLGKNMTRLPGPGHPKHDSEGQQWKEFVQSMSHPDRATKKTNKSHKKTKQTSKKKNSPGWCCCSAKNILNSVAGHQMVQLPLLDFDGNTFVKNQDGSYELTCEDNEVHHVKIQLKFVPNTDAIRNGHDGVVDGDNLVQDFFYYTLPHCTVTGTVTMPDEAKPDKDDEANTIHRKNFFILGQNEDEPPLEPVKTVSHTVTGTGWYDHQFGCKKPTNNETSRRLDGKENAETAVSQPSYTWMCLQLDQGYQLCCSEYFFHKNPEEAQEALTSKAKARYFAVLVDPNGQRHQIDTSSPGFSVTETGERWVSMTTFADYPVQWEIAMPTRNAVIQIEATFKQQEFVTIHSLPAIWEGCVKVTGTLDGEPITGKGFVERKGFYPHENQTMEHFFKCVSRETLKSARKVLPMNPEGEKFNELVSHKDNTTYTEYMDGIQYSKALVEPIRTVLDRGGKSWRSYSLMACCDIVGGNSQPLQDWLALPELMHVGSLIVDDVQDRSLVRRGGPCAHIMYGEDIAINAGCYAYFAGQVIIFRGDGDPKLKVDIYNQYFECMRAAHSGQAMDIHGLDYMMDDVVEHGGDLCRQRVLAIHRLKSAAPASMCAGMGGKFGGGSKKQSDGLAAYFEALGIAFQIVDDVLNLHGFTNGLKTKGEDITAGKVTYPIAVAMNRLDKADRAQLWEILKSKPEDIETIGEAVALVEKVDAIQDSFKEARELIEDGWRKLDPLVVDSMVKINLRAFSLYVLDRTY